MNYKTPQEEFWAGTFGEQYIDRNNSKQLLASNIMLFSKIIQNMKKIENIIELGSNIGLNLQAIKAMMPDIACTAVEINTTAANILQHNIPNCHIINESILDLKIKETFDIVLTKGLLIHMAPETLDEMYEKIYHLARKYIIIAEYYNPTPVELLYREEGGKLFKRDFAGEMLQKYYDLKLIDYGFSYHRDEMFPQDDITWFLLEKEF